MSGYQSAVGAFESATSQSRGTLQAYKKSASDVLAENKNLVSGAKAIAQNKVVADLVGGMSFESAIRLAKPNVKKALSWADSKTGGRVSKDTRMVKDMLKKKTGFDKFEKKVTDKVEEVKDKAKKSIKKVLKKVSDKVQGKGQESKGDDEGGKEDDDVEEDEELPDIGDIEPPKMVNMGQDTSPPEEAVDQRSDGVEMEDFNKDAAQDSKEAENYASETKEDTIKNSEIDAENKETGADEEDDDAKDDADETTVVEEEDAGDTLEGLGGAADATGIGAIVGIPLEIAGGVLELAGAIQAGDGIVNWFKQDILGDKPALKVPKIPMPTRPKTLVSQGFQATPMYSSTFDRPHGSGSW